MARGRPSRRRHTSATAGAFPGVRANLWARLRSGDEQPHGRVRRQVLHGGSAGRAPRGGRRSGRGHFVPVLAGHSQGGPARCQHLQARTRREQSHHLARPRARARGCPAPAAPAARSSSRSVSCAGRAPSSRTPRARATAGMTRSGSATGASQTNHTPSGKDASRSAATAWARRVLPMPGAPVSVTRRTPGRSASPDGGQLALAPTKLVSGAGRLVRGGAGARPGPGRGRAGRGERVGQPRRRRVDPGEHTRVVAPQQALLTAERDQRRLPVGVGDGLPALPALHRCPADAELGRPAVLRHPTRLTQRPQRPLQEGLGAGARFHSRGRAGRVMVELSWSSNGASRGAPRLEWTRGRAVRRRRNRTPGAKSSAPRTAPRAGQPSGSAGSGAVDSGTAQACIARPEMDHHDRGVSVTREPVAA